MKVFICLSDAIKPKARPRLGRGGNVYSPTGKHETTLAWLIRAQTRATFAGPVRVSLTCAGRGDLDNQVKTVLDGLQKAGVFANDRQVKEIRAVQRDGPTEIVVEDLR